MNAPEIRPRFQLTAEQHQLLLQPLHRSRVGKNPKGYSHLEAWDVRRWLIRIFGFGGYKIENRVELVKEIESPPGSIKYRNGGSNDKTVWTVVYRAEVRLTVFDQYGGSAVFEDVSCGDSSNQPLVGDCHDNAIKTAVSQGLKRCAVNLGDQFGLGLYNDGGLEAVVVRAVVGPLVADSAPSPMAVEDAPVRPEPGTAPAPEEHRQEQGPQPQARPVSGPPAALSAAATGLLDDLKQATDEPGLRRVWRAAVEADNEGRVSKAEAEHFQGQWKTRKEQLFPSNPATEPQHKKIHALCKEAGLDDRDDRLRFLSEVTGRPIDTQRRLSVDDAKAVIDRLDAVVAQNNPPAEQEGQAAA